MQLKYLFFSIIYMAVLGVLCFPVGRLLAKKRFDAGKFPFAVTSFEKKHNIYDRLKVRSWQKLVPDVSRMFPGLLPKKELSGIEIDSKTVALMINETCVAELVHIILPALGIAFIFIWPGAGGIILFLTYLIIGNIPFILIQRYNRPRLIRLRAALEKKEEKKRLSLIT